jgi:hypothetical protein
MGYVVDTLLPGIVVAVIVIAGAFVLLVRRHVERADAREFGNSDTGGPAIMSGNEGTAHGVHDCTGSFAGGDCGGGDGGGGGD